MEFCFSVYITWEWPDCSLSGHGKGGISVGFVTKLEVQVVMLMNFRQNIWVGVSLVELRPKSREDELVEN